jgi:hypothetical protein
LRRAARGESDHRGGVAFQKAPEEDMPSARRGRVSNSELCLAEDVQWKMDVVNSGNRFGLMGSGKSCRKAGVGRISDCNSRSRVGPAWTCVKDSVAAYQKIRVGGVEFKSK